jgi:LMBR1 domain-containing protein 1
MVGESLFGATAVQGCIRSDTSCIRHPHRRLDAANTVPVLTSQVNNRVDKIKNSICGHRCGYILSNPQVFNPLNYIFLQASKVYPIDYVFMVILILYFVISTIVGIMLVGIRFLWYTPKSLR